MRLLILSIILFFSSVATSQYGPWQLIVDGTPALSSPISLVAGRTDISPIKNFEYKSSKLGGDIYDATTGKLKADLRDVFQVRFGFSYRVTPGETFADFAVFADVGTGIDPVKLGYYTEGRPDVWRDVNPEATIFSGDSVALNGAQLYIEVYGGGVDVANFDIYAEKKHVEESTPTVTSVIWAEESGGLVVNTNGQYSFGNGATGGANYGMPIWEEMEAVGMVINAEVKGTSTTVGYTIDAVLRPADKRITTTDHTNVFYFAESETLTQGQLLNFRTTAEVGSWSDVRVGLIVRQKIQFE